MASVPLSPVSAATAEPLRLGLVAGEASGDLLGGLLLQGLGARWPALQAAGIGGPRMAAMGFESWWPQDRLSVFGYVDAIKRLPELLRIRRRLGDRLLRERPAAFIGIDAPDFNFGLETRLRRGGIKTLHFVCPSIWAWRGERVQKIRAAADHVLCLFPFEPALLQRHGIAASFVGHPLADAIPADPPRAAARRALGLAEDASVVALLPGSRGAEIRYLAPVFLQTAARLQRERPGLRFVLPAAPGLAPLLDPLIAEHASGVDLLRLEGRSHEALAACDLTLIASGTATLEAALFKRPMVIGYRMHPLSWQVMKRMAYQPWVGLPNILAREFLVPERIQQACTPQQLARDVLAGLDDAAGADRLRRRFAAMHDELKRDTAQAASAAIAELIDG